MAANERMHKRLRCVYSQQLSDQPEACPENLQEAGIITVPRNYRWDVPHCISPIFRIYYHKLTLFRYIYF